MVLFKVVVRVVMMSWLCCGAGSRTDHLSDAEEERGNERLGEHY